MLIAATLAISAFVMVDSGGEDDAGIPVMGVVGTSVDAVDAGKMAGKTGEMDGKMVGKWMKNLKHSGKCDEVLEK